MGPYFLRGHKPNYRGRRSLIAYFILVFSVVSTSCLAHCNLFLVSRTVFVTLARMDWDNTDASNMLSAFKEHNKTYFEYMNVRFAKTTSTDATDFSQSG